MLQSLMRRPLAYAAFLYLVVFFLILFCQPSLSVCLLLALGIGLLWLFCLILFLLPHTLRRFQSVLSLRLPLILLLSALLIPTLWGGAIIENRRLLTEEFSEKDVRLTVRLDDVKQYDDVTSVKGEILSIDGEHRSYRTTLTFFTEPYFENTDGSISKLARGDILTGVFTLSAVDGNTLAELWRFADGYDLDGVYVKEGFLLEHAHKNLYTLSSYLSERFGALIDSHLGENGKGLMKALMLADNQSLKDGAVEQFQILGISHLLAVSGLHLTILVGAVSALFNAFALDRRIFYPLLSVITLLYAVITGFAPSLLRAGGMLLLFYLSYYVSRRRDTITALLSATAIIVTVSPRSILDLGLLLSFGATGGILLLATPIQNKLFSLPYFEGEHHPIRSFVILLLKAALPPMIVTFAATLAILPILLLSSGDIFLLAPLTNILFTPFFNGLIYLFPIFLLTCQIPFVSKIVSLIIELFSFLILHLSELALYLELFSFSLAYAFTVPIFLLLCLIALPFFIKKKRTVALVILSLFFLIMPLSIGIHEKRLTSTYGTVYLTDGKNDLMIAEDSLHAAMIAFSSSRSYIKRSLSSHTLSSPSIETDTLILPNPANADAAMLQDIREKGVKHLVLCENASTDYLAEYAERLGFTVTRFSPCDTVVYNGIKLVTHQGTTGKILAVELHMGKERLLYLSENAPNDFDIRFGVMKEDFSTVILGGYGADMKGTLALSAPTVWESREGRGYIRRQKEQTVLYGDNAVTIEKE